MAARTEVRLRKVNVSVVSDCGPVDDTAHQAPLPTEFSRQDYGVGYHSFLQGISLNPGIKSGSPASQADSSPPEPPAKPSDSPRAVSEGAWEAG